MLQPPFPYLVHVPYPCPEEEEEDGLLQKRPGEVVEEPPATGEVGVLSLGEQGYDYALSPFHDP